MCADIVFIWGTFITTVLLCLGANYTIAYKSKPVKGYIHTEQTSLVSIFSQVTFNSEDVLDYNSFNQRTCRY